MIGKNTIKLIKSLSAKKQRLKEKLFVVEGDKNVSEVLNSDFKVEQLFATRQYLEKQEYKINAGSVIEVSKAEIVQSSLLINPQNCIALCSLPETKPLPERIDSLAVFLDEIQDPGNMGTIIRICDWFGIAQLFCSPGCADLFNPKVIQASMGSFCRVNVWSSDFSPVAGLAENSGCPVFGAFLEGENIYHKKLPERALLVMGNEGNGISEENAVLIQQKIRIPDFSVGTQKAESLNVAVATAIICSEFRRQSNFPRIIQNEGTM